MAKKNNVKTAADDVAVTERDILFECPSCGKSLVVDQSAEGMIIDCPQCHINVIVPPKTTLELARAEPPPHPGPAPEHKERVAAPAPTVGAAVEVARLQEQVTLLGSRLKEIQTQWADTTNRIAARINEVNRELIGLSRLEISHKQLLKEWNEVIAHLTAANEAVVKDLPTVPGK